MSMELFLGVALVIISESKVKDDLYFAKDDLYFARDRALRDLLIPEILDIYVREGSCADST